MKWLNKIRQALINDIAAATERRMTGQGWGKFLPPVAFRDCVYLMREDGAIFRMHQDPMRGMEIITKLSNIQ